MRGEVLLGVLILGLLFLGSAYIASAKPERYPSYPFGPAVALGSIFVVIGLTGFLWNYRQSLKVVVPIKKEPISIPKQRPYTPPFAKRDEEILLSKLANLSVLAREIIEFIENKYPEELEKRCISEQICELFWKTKGVTKENIQNPEILLRITEAELMACRKLASVSESIHLISRLPCSVDREREQSKGIKLLSTQTRAQSFQSMLDDARYATRARAKKMRGEENAVPPLSGRQCPECGSNRLVRDSERAEIICMNCGFVGDTGKFIGSRTLPFEQEPISRYVSRRGKVVSIYKESQRYRIGKNNLFVNESLVNKVDEYLRKSGSFLSSKKIEEGLKKYYSYRALDIHVWNALRVLISLGKVKRCGSGNNVLYKTTCPSSKPQEQQPNVDDVLVIDKGQEKIIAKAKEESQREARRYARGDW